METKEMPNKECDEYRSGCEFTDCMFALAKEAWGELMKEKIKKCYEEMHGEHMDKVAKIAAEGCSKYWKSKMQQKQDCAELRAQFEETCKSCD